MVFHHLADELRLLPEGMPSHGLLDRLRRFPRHDDLDRVNLGLGTPLARRLGKPVSARQYLLTAIELAGPDSAIAERARAELERI